MNSRNENNPLTPALAAGGALLLFISLLINWYSLDAEGEGVPNNLSLGIARPDTALLLFSIAAGAALIIALGRFRGSIRGLSTVLAGLGAACLIFVLASIIKKPQLLDLVESGIDTAKEQAADQLDGADLGIGLDIGVWIALLGSLLLLAAGLMEMLGNGDRGHRGPGAGASAPPAPSPAMASPGAGGPLGGGPGAGATPGPTATVGAPTPADPSPGWKPDPYGQAQQRYWDGASWTQHTG